MIALKVLESEKLFKWEQQFYTMLNDAPGAPALYYTFEEGSRYYLGMEYLDRDLRSLRNDSAQLFAIDAVAWLARELVS
jgi:serine/threonine protein kinase